MSPYRWRGGSHRYVVGPFTLFLQSWSGISFCVHFFVYIFSKPNILVFNLVVDPTIQPIACFVRYTYLANMKSFLDVFIISPSVRGQIVIFLQQQIKEHWRQLYNLSKIDKECIFLKKITDIVVQRLDSRCISFL